MIWERAASASSRWKRSFVACLVAKGGPGPMDRDSVSACKRWPRAERALDVRRVAVRAATLLRAPLVGSRQRLRRLRTAGTAKSLHVPLSFSPDLAHRQ